MSFDMTSEERIRYEAAKEALDAKDQAWRDEVADILGAKQSLEAYAEQLDARFLPGGWFETGRIPSGEAFVELVCGGEYDGHILCQCHTPHVAVRVFIDTVERYIAALPRQYGPSRHHTLYWRVYPMLLVSNTGEWTGYDRDAQRVVTKRETLFNVRARLLIL